jgi:hypothetical protein
LDGLGGARRGLKFTQCLQRISQFLLRISQFLLRTSQCLKAFNISEYFRLIWIMFGLFWDNFCCTFCS